MSMKLPENIRKKIEEALKQGKMVVLHPEASKKIPRTERVEPVDWPPAPKEKK